MVNRWSANELLNKSKKSGCWPLIDFAQCAKLAIWVNKSETKICLRIRWIPSLLFRNAFTRTSSRMSGSHYNQPKCHYLTNSSFVDNVFCDRECRFCAFIWSKLFTHLVSFKRVRKNEDFRKKNISKYVQYEKVPLIWNCLHFCIFWCISLTYKILNSPELLEPLIFSLNTILLTPHRCYLTTPHDLSVIMRLFW